MVQGWFVASLHELFSKDGFRPRKSAGQNFLVDTKILGRIESVIRPSSDEVMLEVGGGTGALTERLVKKKSPLIVVESDHKLFDHLVRNFGKLPMVHLVKADIMKLDLAPFVPPPWAKSLRPPPEPFITSATHLAMAEASALPSRAMSAARAG